MEGVEKVLTIEEVAEQLMRCKLEVFNKISDIDDQLLDGTTRMEEIEDILSKHEKQRQDNYTETKEYLDSIAGQLSSYRNDFNMHDRVEMEKYDKIIDALNSLTSQLKKTADETDANTIFLNLKKKQDEIDDAVKKALDDEHAPYREYKKQAVLAVVGIISTAVVVGGWKLVMFVSDMDNLIKGTQ